MKQSGRFIPVAFFMVSTESKVIKRFEINFHKRMFFEHFNKTTIKKQKDAIYSIKKFHYRTDNKKKCMEPQFFLDTPFCSRVEIYMKVTNGNLQPYFS